MAFSICQLIRCGGDRESDRVRVMVGIWKSYFYFYFLFFIFISEERELMARGHSKVFVLHDFV